MVEPTVIHPRRVDLLDAVIQEAVGRPSSAVQDKLVVSDDGWRRLAGLLGLGEDAPVEDIVAAVVAGQDVARLAAVEPAPVADPVTRALVQLAFELLPEGERPSQQSNAMKAGAWDANVASARMVLNTIIGGMDA